VTRRNQSLWIIPDWESYVICAVAAEVTKKSNETDRMSREGAQALGHEEYDGARKGDRQAQTPKGRQSPHALFGTEDNLLNRA
jgi:hypothetical protein